MRCMLLPNRAQAPNQRRGNKMSIKLIDDNGTEITGKISMMFVCDMCSNSEPFFHGMSNYSIINGNKVKSESYCSELCVRKALENLKEKALV